MKTLIGEKFGRLTVEEKAERPKHIKSKRAYWKCKCDCGNEIIATTTDLKTGHTKSCGCLRAEKISKMSRKHGKRNERIYDIWRNMRKRCNNPKCDRYKDYGERGIEVCKEWNESFINFYKWSTNSGYNDKLTLDRINVDGNYEPSNCRWQTYKQQNNNKRNTTKVEYKNKEYTLRELSDEFNIDYEALRKRINAYKWEISKAIETPVKTTKK